MTSPPGGQAPTDARAILHGVSGLQESGAPFFGAILDCERRPTVLHSGLQLPGKLSFDSWYEIGRRLSSFNSASAWCLGDWLLYGENAFEGRYRKAIEGTMLDYQTLRNYAWVAGKFPLARRRDNISFGHHAEVAAMDEPEQDYWLRKAEELSWSRNMLRKQVRESLHMREQGGNLKGDPASPGMNAEESRNDHRSADETAESSRDEATFKVAFNNDQLNIFEAAADASGLTLEMWVLRSLERVAKSELKLDHMLALLIHRPAQASKGVQIRASNS